MNFSAMKFVLELVGVVGGRNRPVQNDTIAEGKMLLL